MKGGVEGVPQYRHFVLAVEQGNRLLFVCETQPLLTIKSHGLHKRCPFCGEQEQPRGLNLAARTASRRTALVTRTVTDTVTWPFCVAVTTPHRRRIEFSISLHLCQEYVYLMAKRF